MATPKLLLIDDDLALLECLPETLRIRLSNVTVETCSLASAAINLIRATDYSAIVCDLRMPNMDGFELLKETRKVRPRTPVLLITAHGGQGITKQALLEGVYDLILKPFDADFLVLAVRRALETHYLRSHGVTEDVEAAILCVKGLESSTTIAQLKEMFTPFGRVQWASLVADANPHSSVFGYVEMAAVSQAQQAIGALEGTTVAGRPIDVSYCTDVLRRRTF